MAADGLLAANGLLNLSGCGNEAKFGRLEVTALFYVEFTDGSGLGKFLFELRAAEGLCFAELIQGGLELPVDALFVKTQDFEFLKVISQGLSGGEGGLHFTGVRAIPNVELRRVLFVAEREEAGFEGAEAIEAPLVIGNGLCELGFEDAFGAEIIH